MKAIGNTELFGKKQKSKVKATKLAAKSLTRNDKLISRVSYFG